MLARQRAAVSFLRFSFAHQPADSARTRSSCSLQLGWLSLPHVMMVYLRRTRGAKPELAPFTHPSFPAHPCSWLCACCCFCWAVLWEQARLCRTIVPCRTSALSRNACSHANPTPLALLCTPVLTLAFWRFFLDPQTPFCCIQIGALSGF